MNKACVHHDVPEEASLEKEKSEGKRQEDSVRIEVKEEVTVMDSTQEVVKGCKEVDRCESQEVLNVNFDKEETQTVVLRGAEPQKIEEAKEELRGILGESGQLEKCSALVEKKLTLNKSFTRALTDKGGNLLKDIRKYSGTDIYFSHSSGGGVETVVLLGASESVVKAEQMLEELLASAEEICLSGEEREALLTRGKRCIMGKIQQKLQVPAQLQGQKMMLFGKPEETREAKVVAEGELKLVSKILSGR